MACAHYCLSLSDHFSQAQQCRKAPLPIHTRRANPLRSDRMSQAASFTSLCRQASGLSRHYAAARRESGSPHARHKLFVQVFAPSSLSTTALADMYLVTSSTRTSTSSASPSALSATSPRSKCRAICSRISRPSFPAPTHTFDEKPLSAP